MTVKTPRLLIIAAALALALAPIAADARLGSGGSMGSRGGMTFAPPPSTNTAPNGASPFNRTLSQPSPSPYQQTPYGRPRSPFMSGLFGGLVGAGLFGLLFGGGFFGHGMGFGGMIGFLFQIFLLVMIGRWLFRRFFGGGGNPAFAGGPGMLARTPLGGMMGGGAGGFGGGMSQPPGPPTVQIAPADFQAFEQLLQAAQAAWSAGDLNALRGMATPEMVSYFAEQLADLSSRGVTNNITDVHLQSGDLAQAWAEAGRQYATVAMRFTMIDVTKDSLGRVVDGSPTEHQTATELWTFVRAQGGHWILSAIQQAR